MRATVRDRWAAGVAGAMASALVVRVVAAVVVETLARRAGGLCLFDDTRIYWHLAGTIVRREPFVVMQYDQPHYALRTPGYPLFLAICRGLLGDSTLVPRLLQAGLGAMAVGVLAVLVARLGEREGRDAERWRRAGVWTAWLAAFEPFGAAMSALLLSEGLFAPLVIFGLWSLNAAFSTGGRAWLALAAGVIQGALVMVRPSWALFPLIAVPALWLGMRPISWRQVVFLGVGAILVMTPWWVRNARVYDGRFVPTSLWLGASLYDGLNESATGASDMRFMDDPLIRTLDEQTQDRRLRDQALAFAQENPARAARLAVVKLGRYFSPWPNAEMLRSPWLAVGGALLIMPLYVLMLAGFWRCRRDGRALLLLAGPMLYTALLHTAFVSSIRYRIPVQTPALALAALALAEFRSRGASTPTGEASPT